MFGSGPRQGRVGIGTTQPDRLIDVAGDIKIDQNIYDSDNNPGQDGFSYQEISMVSAGFKLLQMP